MKGSATYSLADEFAVELSVEQINFCMECGVCTGSCPVSGVLDEFSPRQMVKRFLVDEQISPSRQVWRCLTCARCSIRCPVGIDFPEFIRTCRQVALKDGVFPNLSHHGVVQLIAQLQIRCDRQDRTGWAREIGRFKEKGEYFFFVGCAPYFDAVLPFGYVAMDSVRSVLILLNRLGIEPVISDYERCCGHDAFWSGDLETFKALADLNLQAIADAGAKKVIFGCPEGYTIFKEQIPRYFGSLPFEIIHISELLASELSGSGFRFKRVSSELTQITYQDPCRLGRKAGIYDAPRKLVQLIPGLELREMERSRENAVCCGTSAWLECSSYSKAMQEERLKEALDTGAGILLTACPKCRIHFSCTLNDTNLKLSVEDLYTFVLNHIE